ncbi:hypothetical protein JHK87_045179 [Glycine soja]|nr:hypothetical protein JHK87_045179 [Glycine soja]
MLSLEYPSTRVSSLKAEDIDAKCPHVITFDVDTYVLQLTAGTKLVCSFLFLSVPSKSSNSLGEQPSSLASRTLPDYVEHGIVQKLLLVGCSGSGTSIIFKQVDNRMVAQLLESILFIIDVVLPRLGKLPPSIVGELEQHLKQIIVGHSFFAVVHIQYEALAKSKPDVLLFFAGVIPTLFHSESRCSYSWWWDSHLPKNSKWLQENLAGMKEQEKC